MAGVHEQRDRTDPSLALHDRTPSDSRQAIRMVPYSPPRLESQQSQYSQHSQHSPYSSQYSPTSPTSPTPTYHAHSLSLPLQGPASPTPSSPRSSRHRQQRQRKHRSRELDDGIHVDDREGGANDSDRTATTATSRRSKASRPSSWGPAAAFAAAMSAVSAVASAASGSRLSIGSDVRSERSERTEKSDRSERSDRQGSVLSEKSRNVMMGANWRNAKTSAPGAALATPVGAENPLARGSTRGVSGPKLISPAASATSTSDTLTPPLRVRHSRYGAQNKSSYAAGDYDATSSTSSRLLAHPSQGAHQHRHQHQPHNASPASPASSRPRFGLPPASASFSAAAASYLSEHSSNISNIADSLVSPSSPASPASPASPESPESIASPASAYSAFSASPAPSYVPSSYPSNYSPSHPSSTFPPSSLQSSLPSSYQSSTSYPSSSYPPATVATSASSYTLAAPSLSPSPSIGSLSSVSSSQAAVPRPHSRRRNIIAVHSDKTFSLVPRGVPPSSLLSLSNSATASTVRTLSNASHERLFSYGAYTSGDHPSSPLSTAASHLELDQDLDQDLNLHFDDPQPWNQRLVGSLRIDLPNPSPRTNPKTPDAKRKGKGRADTFASQPRSLAQFLPSLPETSSPTAVAALEFDSPYSASASASASASTPKTAGVSSRSPKKKPSSASVQSFDSSALSFSASTLSATTNYKVYARGSSPAARLDSTDSLVLSSSPAHPGDTTNVQILGVSSPAAAPLPELQRSTDPDQSFASLNSYPSIASFDTGLSDNNYNDSTLPNFVVLGASSPPAPSRYLDHTRSISSSSARDADADADTDIDISSPPLPPRTANTTTDSLGTSDSDQNYVLHGEPSSIFLPPSSQQSPSSVFLPPPTESPSQTPAPPQTSSSSGSSLATISKRPRQVYSRESLVVPPLKTVRAKRSNERFGYYKSRSRESLRRAASLKSISSSIFSQEAASTFFAGQAFLSISIPPVPVFSAPKAAFPLYSQQQLPAFLAKTKLKRKPLPLPAPPVQSENIVVYGQQTPKKNTRGLPADESDAWESTSSSPPQLTSPSASLSASLSASPRPPSPTLPQQPKIRVQMVEEHPHQWSSQLSTVMSESEDESMDIRLVSRSVSVMSATPSRAESNGSGGGRRSSAGWASNSHSRNMPSISSSLAMQLEDMRDRNSRDSSLLDRPSPAFFRGAAGSPSPATPGNGNGNGAPIRTVRDIDEHGDGLADLHDMSSQPSRSGLSGFFTNSSNSVRNVHSSSSMRSLRSIGSSSGGHFPSWARVYYGSGEHRALSVAPSVSDLGQGEGDDYMTGAMRPNSAFRRSPSVDNGPLSLFYSRRRPRDAADGQADGARPYSEAADMEAGGHARRPQRLRKITSSIWSPHLQMDRRAARFSVWDPPSVAWSDAASRFDRRNMQVILFTVGFIVPFAWMAAALLPLPLDPKRAMEKRLAEGEGEYGVAEALKQRVAQADENRFQSARWWRSLNRVMSLVGVLVLGAVVALVVVAVEQHWGQ